ncbi:MAG TPA: hypothetical protein VNT24_03560, partial [Propionibacteriaceae bacterium]|nr:hypothetical protein [Propionibacteriaceae bacterium]
MSAATFRYLRAFTWRRVIGWIRRKHPGMTWQQLRRRYCHGGWWPTDGERALFDPGRMQTTRYRYRGAAIPGHCWESGGAPAYWPWVQCPRVLVRELEPGMLATQLGVGAADLAEIVPELRQ